MLTKKTKYAIRALMVLGENVGNPPVHISDMAAQENIPEKYLAAILGELRNAGLVYSKKGAGGGYTLSKNPEDILLVQILRLTDGPIALVSCASLNYCHKCEECLDEGSCGIKTTFIIIRDACLEILSQQSIADLIKKEKELSTNIFQEVY